MVPMDYTKNPDVKLPLQLIENMPELKVWRSEISFIFVDIFHSLYNLGGVGAVGREDCKMCRFYGFGCKSLASCSKDSKSFH